jgi:hypothetical protein
LISLLVDEKDRGALVLIDDLTLPVDEKKEGPKMLPFPAGG